MLSPLWQVKWQNRSREGAVEKEKNLFHVTCLLPDTISFAD